MKVLISKLKLSQLIVSSLAVVGLVPLFALVFFLTNQSESALERTVFNQLNSVRSIKSKQVEDYFSDRESDLKVLANIVSYFHIQAIQRLEKETVLKTKAISELIALHHKELILFSSSNETSNALKAFNTNFVPGENVRDSAGWQFNEMIYGENVRSFQKNFGWYDAFLISPDGNILYSSEQNSALGKNIKDDSIVHSGLAESFFKARTDNILEQKTYFGDFSFFEPSQDFASFILTKVLRDQELVGYVALQLPLQRINNILNVSDENLVTGEYSYLVGTDKKLRSDTAFLSIANSYRDSSLIDTPSVNAGLSGKAGNGITRNSEGELVLSQWQLIEVSNDTHWIFINEVSIENALVPMDSAGNSFYRKYIEEYGYYDVFLIEPEGEIFYTEAKESDYRTNILSGQYSSSNLGTLINDVKRTGRFGLVDFALYEPSRGQPASFIAIPVLGQAGKPDYFVALQLSLDSINAMMQLREGMGETGETYLVGEDYRMRSDSYLDKEGHSVMASFAGKVNSNGVKTEATELALSGQSGVKEIIDYNGNSVLSSFSTLPVGSKQWVVIAEIDSSEAFEAISTIRISTLIALGGALMVTFSLAIYLSGIIRRPLGGEPTEMVYLAEQIASGDLTYQFENDVKPGSVYASLKEMSTHLTKLISNILESSQALASTAEETSVASEQATVAIASQQVDTEMVAIAVNQMVSTVSDVAKNTESAALLTKEAHDRSEEGILLLNNSMDAINTLVVDIRSTSADMDVLVENTTHIDQVLTVIQTITEQTNLLALNAAIEAARAGEHGKGFAVVADEVRQLAQKTQNSATDIQFIVSTLQNAARGSVEKMEKSVQQAEVTSTVSHKTAEAFREIGTAITKIDDMMAQISTASEQQAQVSEDISRRIVHINEVSIETSARSQQLSVSSHEVARLAESLTTYTTRFKI